MNIKKYLFVGGVACASVAWVVAEDHLELGEPSNWTVVGTPPERDLMGFGQRHVVCSNAVEILEGQSDSEAARHILVAENRWRETEEDRRRDEETIDRVLPRIQSGLDAFVLKWDADGKSLEGRPWRSLERWTIDRRGRDSRIYLAKFRNCWNLTLALLLQNKELLKACQGVPFERLIQRLRFPEPRYEWEDGKKVFEQWASGRLGSRLTMHEKKILFRWQFYVVEHERRPWMKLVQATEAMAESAGGDSRLSRIPRGSLDTCRSVPQKLVPYMKGFADFELGERSAADFVEDWYGKAVAAGMKTDKDDEMLKTKARAAKTSWPGSVGISISQEYTQKKIKIHGAVSMKELQSVRDGVLCGLGVDENNRFALELDEPDKMTLKNVFDVFPVDRVRSCQLSGDGELAMDVTDLAKCTHLYSVSLRDCKVLGGVSLSKCADLSRFSARDCDLGGLDILSGCAALTEVKLENCSFTNLKSLWAANHLSELSVPNSKNIVDLSAVRKFERLMLLDITGCQVKSFTALRRCQGLKTLKMEHVKGGVESLSCLMDHPALQNVVYDKADFPSSVYLEFARARRIKEYGDDPERMLEEAVKDQDLSEIKRLCEGGVNTDAALSEFEFSGEADMEVFRLLVPKATEEVLTEQLEKYCSAFGDRASHRRRSRRSSGKPPYVPTNRTEIVGLLLKHGAHSDEAISNMAHPAKEDLEIFRMMLPAASQKVKTELLQKNVKSFGDHGSWDRKVGHAADRIEVVRLLLERDADPNARDFFGKTPLGNAIEYDGDIRLVKLLFDKGAVAGSLYPKMEIFRNFYQGHGDNVWGTNRYELVELLLTHGFDVNSRGQFGKTPLGELVSFGGYGEPYDMKMAKLLLEHGADPNMKQGENMGSAIDIAFGKFDAKELTELLSKYGGVVSEEAKQKQKERKARRRPQVVDGRSSRRHGSSNGRGERIHEEMERFHNELRKCTDPKGRSKLFEEHSRRMREINEFPNHEGVRMQDHKEEVK